MELHSLPANTNIQARLAEELSHMVDVDAIALIDFNGKLIASVNIPNANNKALEKSVELLDSAKYMLSALDKGEFYQVFVRGKDGYAVVTNISTKAIFVASMSEKAKIGLLLMDLQRTALILERLL